MIPNRVAGVLFVLAIVNLPSCRSGKGMRLSDVARAHLAAEGWSQYAGSGTGIWVDVNAQKLHLISNYQITRSFSCSTGRPGTGNLRDSGMTPLGWHEIAARIGDGLEVGAVLEERVWTGELWEQGTDVEGDLILSRILWLKGLEHGKNLGGDVDTWSRYIYIHGTNHPDQLGRPASHGCVRLSPRQAVELFDLVSVGCPVLITD